MILYFAAAIFIGFVGGQVWERYRWVRSCKNNLVIEVDGVIYKTDRVDKYV